MLDRFIERNRAFIRRVSPAAAAAAPADRARTGAHHDLRAIFAQLNHRYFGGRMAAAITYGPAPRARRPRKSIKMGSLLGGVEA